MKPSSINSGASVASPSAKPKAARFGIPLIISLVAIALLSLAFIFNRWHEQLSLKEWSGKLPLIAEAKAATIAPQLLKNMDGPLEALIDPALFTTPLTTSYPSLQIMLLRKRADAIEQLAPHGDDSAISEQEQLFAIENPGTFSLVNKSGGNLLQASTLIPESGWVVLARVAQQDALKESAGWRKKMMLIFLSTAAVVCGLMFAIWRSALHVSRRPKKSDSQTSTTAREKLLHLVADNQPDPIYIVDGNNVCWFANARMVRGAHNIIGNVVGKPLDMLVGPGRAKDIAETNQKAMASGMSLSSVRRVSDEEKVAVIRAEHIPLRSIPMDGMPKNSPGVLVVEHDITEVVNERERRARTLRQLIDTLVMLVDQRDPYSANHSAYVAQIARDIAAEMKLETMWIDTTEIAGRLMNIGKIIVPSELLTKRESLNENEMRTIRSGMDTSANLLQKIEFDGPVVETLRQAQEHWDGSGPMKLRGDDILISARIIAVANAFVGMISPRSYRSAIGVDAATKILLENINSKYDRGPVVALVNNIESRGTKDSTRLFVAR